jgi:hypothetical protein
MPTKSKSARATNKSASATRAAKKSTGRTARTGRNPAGSRMTTDPEEIRRWAEARGGVPAAVSGTKRRGEVGIIRIDFPDGPEPSLEHISWDEWFQKFNENGLALVYQEKTSGGQPSRFNKIVKRETAEAQKASRRTPAKTRAAGSRGHS